MRKAVLLLLFIVLLAGCSSEKSKENDRDSEDRSTFLAQKDSEKDTKGSSSSSGTGNQDTNQINNTSDPMSSSKSSTYTTGPGADIIADMLKKDKVIEYTGAVGNSKIHMVLNYQGDQITGTYYYDKYKNDISLSGALELFYNDYPSFTLTEDTEQQGQFIGLIINEDYIKGCWKSWNELFPMYLIRTDADVSEPKAPGKDLLSFDGQWKGKNSTYFIGSDLIVKALYEDLLYFDLSAYSGTATGALSGLAIYQNGSAKAILYDHINWEDASSEHVSFEFSRKDQELSLESNQYDYYCGMGVSYDAAYSSDMADIAFPTLIDVGIVDNKEQEELFKKTVDYLEYSFIQNTQYVIYEDILLDGRKARAGTSYLRGASGLCYYINASDYMYAAIYEEGKIQYYTNDLNYADHMPEPMKIWAEQYQTEIVYNEVSAPYPFDSRIPEILLKQRHLLKQDKEITLFSNYHLKDYSFGDINKDGQEDFAVVIEQGSGKYTGSRRIYIFLNQKGNYELTFENSTLILGNMEGGAYGDPYEGILISEGEFCVFDFGGSSYRWGHTYSFSYQDKQLILAGIDLVGFNTHNLNGTYNTYNLIDGTVQTRTSYESGDAGDTEKNYNDLLIYEGRIKNNKKIYFAEAKAWCEEQLTIEPPNTLPSPGDYTYGLYSISELKYSPEEILDKVKMKYYPGLKKVQMNFSQEILDNNSYLYGYQIPTYYYSDGKNNLYYYGLGPYYDSNRLQHSVLYSPLDDSNWSESVFYQYWDDTGEEDN